MEKLMLILSIISTFAAVVSAIIAVKSKNEAKSILEKTRIITSKTVNNPKTKVVNNGDNSGVITGVSTGEIKNVK